MKFRPGRFFFSRPWYLVIPESWLGALLLFFLVFSLENQITSQGLTSAILIIGVASAIWTYFRWQGTGENTRLYKVFEVVGITLILMVLFPISFIWIVSILNLWPVLSRISTGTSSGLFVLIAVAGLLFPTVYGLGKFWSWWQYQRHKHLANEITHTIFSIFFVLALLVSLVFNLMIFFRAPAPVSQIENSSLLAVIVAHLVSQVFPLIFLVLFSTLGLLVLVTPLALLFSRLTARKITARLAELTNTTDQFREGMYEARVVVEGGDELTGLQVNFNLMAEKLAVTLEQLKTEQERIQQLLESRRQIFAGVSHDLRTPVATLLAYVETDLNETKRSLPGDVRHDLQVMQTELEQLNAMLDDLFALARKDIDRLQINICSLRLECLLSQIIEGFNPLAWEEKRLQVGMEIQPALPPVCADPIRLTQVLNNLLRNALRHTRPGGIIAVKVSGSDGWVNIEVMDTGEGIVSSEIEHVWERFYQGQHERGDVGLGLALVKELTEAMNGKVNVNSEVGEGTCFTISLLPSATSLTQN